MHWSAGRPEEALKLYDARIWSDGSSENLSLCNDISLLARLEIAGIDVGGRWDAAAQVVREQAGGSVMAFVDAHYALALGAVPPLEDHGTTARVHSAVGRAVCDGAVAWRSKDYARAANLLAPVRKDLWKIGGSHAQRDLFVLMLLDSATRCGNLVVAREVRADRTAQRPNGSLPF